MQLLPGLSAAGLAGVIIEYHGYMRILAPGDYSCCGIIPIQKALLAAKIAAAAR